MNRRRSLLDVLTTGRVLPDGYDRWGLRGCSRGLAHHQPDRWLPPPESYPDLLGDGMRLALTGKAAASIGWSLAGQMQIVAFAHQDVISDNDHKVRVRCGCLVDVVELADIDLRNVELAGANLNDTKLIGVNLRNSNLNGATLIDADLTDADLRNALLTGVFAMGINLTGADMRKANMSRAGLGGANLTGANLTGADLYRAGLIGADLTDTKLLNANLTGAYLTCAALAETDVTATTSDQSTVWPETFNRQKVAA